jgi:hypothetical protein
LIDRGCHFLTLRFSKDMEFPSVPLLVVAKSAKSRSLATMSQTRCTGFVSKQCTEQPMLLVSPLYVNGSALMFILSVADVVYSGNRVSGITYQGVAIEQDYSLSSDCFLMSCYNL